jgi:[protein-PII] uridylyltransferase
MDASTREAVWSLFTEDYFLRYRGEEIAWHTRMLADNDRRQSLVDVRKQANGDGIEAVLYTPRTKRTFAQVTAALDEMGMTIVDARVVPTANGYSIDTFIFLELDRSIEVDHLRLARVRQALGRLLAAGDDRITKVTRRAPRQVRMFTTRAQVDFERDQANGRTIMEIVAGDRPGLLSTIGQAFIALRIDIETAKVMTIGERAEDVFYVVDEAGNPLTPEACETLRRELLEKLDPRDEGPPSRNRPLTDRVT